ncbi:hypothetical protein SAMN05216227_100359 [Pseudorhodobacter antarcticus]|uniref:Uncharacterized protein n=1 Tax=Pseudorhodobacter antarcticus TaxID=1077947 RepID=A0A1H8BKN7_9RHOB|nr:hypothetical protein SAMN05216227_100359 [Pseudorhodobacter antarcticus]
MRLTLRTNLALRTLMFCAVNGGRTLRKREVAQACGAGTGIAGGIGPRLLPKTGQIG